MEKNGKSGAAEVSGAAGEEFAFLGKRPIAVRSNGAFVIVDPGEILFVESDTRKMGLHCEGRIVWTYSSFDELTAILPKSFVRCHKTYLVNMYRAASVSSRQVVLDDGRTVPVGQHQWRHVKASMSTMFGVLKK